MHSSQYRLRFFCLGLSSCKRELDRSKYRGAKIIKPFWQKPRKIFFVQSRIRTCNLAIRWRTLYQCATKTFFKDWQKSLHYAIQHFLPAAASYPVSFDRAAPKNHPHASVSSYINIKMPRPPMKNAYLRFGNWYTSYSEVNQFLF